MSVSSLNTDGAEMISNISANEILGRKAVSFMMILLWPPRKLKFNEALR